jgi:hypothetical protein
MGETLLLDQSLQPTVLLASEFDDLFAIKTKAAWLAGSLAVGEIVELDDYSCRSLLDGINKAASGDEEAYQLVKANVASDVIERTIKAGFITSKVQMNIGCDGSLSQHGQSYLTIQANSLLQAKNHPVMRSRTESEARNAFRMEEMVRQHIFDEYSLVVFSRAEDLPECGFFVDTMSCAIQVTSKKEQALETESAFVAGKDKQGNLYDEEVVKEMYNNLAAVDIDGLSPAEIIDKPLLIPNHLIPNGVVDLVKLYDDLSGGKFFGLDKPKEDYLSYKEHCLRQENNYLDISLKITQQLIAEAGQLKTPVDATRRLNQLSERYTLTMALYDHSIDPQVFGRVAATHLVEARLAVNKGMELMASIEFNMAIKTAVSSSCPGLFGDIKKDSFKDQIADKNSTEDKYGSLQFYCPKGHLNVRPRDKLLANCRVCGVSVKC